MTTLTRLSVLITVVFSVLAATEVGVHVYQALSFVAKTVASFAAVLIAYKLYAFYMRFMERVERLFTLYDKMCQYMQSLGSVETVKRLVVEHLGGNHVQPDTTWLDPLTSSGYVPVRMAEPLIRCTQDGDGEGDDDSDGEGDGDSDGKGDGDDEYVIVETDYEGHKTTIDTTFSTNNDYFK